MPDFDLMNDMEADVMATKSHWDRYADFLRERDEMANRDWLSMRDQVRCARCGWPRGCEKKGGGLCSSVGVPNIARGCGVHTDGLRSTSRLVGPIGRIGYP